MTIEFYTGYLPKLPEDIPSFLEEYTRRVEEAFETLNEDTPWTPVLSDGTNDATHSVQEGACIRIGNLIHAFGRLTTTGLGSVSGDLRITGLPYKSHPESPEGSMTAGLSAGLNLTNGESVVGAVIKDTTYIALGVWKASTGVQAMVDTEWSADGDLLFHAVYRRDAT